MYSQNGEELHIARILQYPDTKPGRFLDIGAYNPTAFSNTRALFERGWGGVMVEAAPGPFLDLLIEYGHSDRVEIVCAAVATERGILEFHHSEAGVATSNEAHYQKWRDVATFDGKFFAASVTIGDICSYFGSNFDFVNIDAEGTSAELFLKALESNLRPKCFCVEHDGRQAELTLAAAARGYRVEHLNGENLILSRD